MAEAIARAFHEAYEELAPDHGYETREASAKPWEEVPEANRQLMQATVAKLLADGVIQPGPALTPQEERPPSYADQTMQPAIDNATAQMDEAEAARTGKINQEIS